MAIGLLFVTGCADDAGPHTAGTTGASATHVTEGHGATFVVPTTPAPPTTATTTTTVPELGLPDSFPVPENGIITLSGDSTYSQAFDVRGVTTAEVHDWIVSNLAALRYAYVDEAPPNVVTFSGDGVRGRVTVSDAVDGVVDVAVVLGAP
jgi:hypothetical protein